MIIKRVWGENVLKYRLLDVRDIPDEGLIAISGLNESGKTTIGEVICFALFGRTFSVGPEEISRVVKWGESRCAVELDFTVGDGPVHRVTRVLDDDGNAGARLTVLGSDEPIAKGVERVNDAVIELVRFGYEEFIESFYLAQREISTPHAHSQIVKIMAGIDALEKVSARLTTEIEQEREGIVETERQITDAQVQIAELNVREDYLPALESEHAALVEAQAGNREEVQRAGVRTDAYQSAVARLQNATGALQRADIDCSHRDWELRVTQLESGLADVDRQLSDHDAPQELTARLHEYVQGWKGRLTALGELYQQAIPYRKRLAALLGEAEGEELGEQAPQPLERRRSELLAEAEAARSTRAAARFGTVFFLLVAVAAWVVWYFVTQAPTTDTGRALLVFLENNVAAEATVRPWLLPVAAVATVLLLFFALRSASLSARIGRLTHDANLTDRQAGEVRREAEGLARLESMPVPQAVAALRAVGDQQLPQAAEAFAQGPGRAMVDAEAFDAERSKLEDLLVASELAVGRQREDLERRSEGVRAELERQAGESSRLQGMIDEERERVQRWQSLRGLAAECEERVQQRQQRIAERELAQELLAGACHDIAKRFNRDVRNLVGRTLPLITEGRYEHLQIDEELNVQAFSSEKRDFVDLDEVSSGTQRQIRLAVRLALAQELINTAVRARQFVFLDEPFAFFDEQRMRKTMAALPKMSDEMTQMWMIAQHFPADAAFDMHIQCAREIDELTATPARVRAESVASV
jgi:hypothetical protein